MEERKDLHVTEKKRVKSCKGRTVKSTGSAVLDTVVGVAVQACADTHVANFGAFASARRNLP